MKFKEIKPGMVIHCPKEENARVLLEHLDGLGYKWVDEKSLTKTTCWNDAFGEGVYYTLGRDKYVTWTNKKSKDEITEFSDLIEPDDSPINSPTDSPMTAMEVLEWLMTMPNETLDYVFGYDSLDEIFRNKSVNEIIGNIAEFEATKKAPKPVEVEWVDVARIAKHEEGSWHYVHEEIIYPKDHTAEDIAETILKEYVSKHDGIYYAFADRICRVKEDK